MTQGGHPNVLDLDDDLTPEVLPPRRVRAFGREWDIRRDWTPSDIVKYWRFANAGKDIDGAKMLVGDQDGAEFAEITLALPPEIVAVKLRRICKIAGVLKRDADDRESEGESSAS